MKSALVSVLLLALLASSSLAVDHRLEFFSDEGLSSCELAMTTPGLVKVHMVATGPGNFGAIAFKAPKPACMSNATWIVDAWEQTGFHASVGNTQGTVGHGVDLIFNCGPMPRYLGWIWFSATGPAEPCCGYSPQPGSWSGDIAFPGYIYMIVYPECQEGGIFFNEVPADAKGLVVNTDETCRCDIPLATRRMTWGSVKALYQ